MLCSLVLMLRMLWLQVTDFGVAKHWHLNSDGSAKRMMAVVGTPGYQPPEVESLSHSVLSLQEIQGLVFPIVF
jgi:serine/threonine protein kinase